MPFMNYISQPETDRFNTLGIPENLEASKINATSHSRKSTRVSFNYIFVIEELESGSFIGILGLKLGSAKYNNAEIWYKLNLYWARLL
jgi:hypothetical protein